MSEELSSEPPPSAEAQVRHATEADLPRIVELLAQLSLDESREELGPPLPETCRRAFQQIQADPNQRLLVAEAGGRVVGTASLLIVPNLSHRGRPYAIVENVVVDATERGAGYGELLLRYAMEEARRAGCYKLSLTSNKRRTDAHRFYGRLGFQATHEGFRVEF
ncbi:MAG: GNAT family N-acetyltransferase [Gemmatimonadetes bacterium]|nr:GNAT family N-acetyltransferase [Gemmatimonadota bacterium]